MLFRTAASLPFALVLVTVLAAPSIAQAAEKPNVGVQVVLSGQDLPGSSIMFAVEPRLVFEWTGSPTRITFAWAGVGMGVDTETHPHPMEGLTANVGGGIDLHGGCVGGSFCGGVRLGGGLQYADYKMQDANTGGFPYTVSTAFVEAQAYVSFHRFYMGVDVREHLVLKGYRAYPPPGQRDIPFGDEAGLALGFFIGGRF